MFTYMTETIGYLYINGLGDGKTTLKDRLVRWWWKIVKVDIVHAHINWYDGKVIDKKIDDVKQLAPSMLNTYDGVVIIGSSAGGSLAFNVFDKLKDRRVCIIIAHGRLGSGSYSDNQRMSLYNRAYLGKAVPSLSFFESVQRAERKVIPGLTKLEMQRILTLSQLTDLVVPLDLMGVKGVKNHRSFAFGHSGGFLAHLLADRDLIIDFAKTVL